MLWGLISSVFVIYLYRSLNAEAAAPQGGDTPPATVEAALADLNKRIDSLELRAGTFVKGATP